MAMRDEIRRRMIARRQAAKSPLDAILTPETEKPMPNNPCPECDGEGGRDNNGNVWVCSACRGTGEATKPAPLKPQASPVLKPDPQRPINTRCSRCGCPRKSHGGHPEGSTACHDCECSMYEPPPESQGDPAPQKRPPNSPKARDARMKGRFPDGTQIYAQWHEDLGHWCVQAILETNTTFSTEDSGIHAALESLWGQYQKWLAEQAASAKEAS